jgi:hypothetical protein
MLPEVALTEGAMSGNGGVWGEVASDDETDARCCDFAPRCHLFDKEGCGARSGMTGMVGQLASRIP